MTRRLDFIVTVMLIASFILLSGVTSGCRSAEVNKRGTLSQGANSGETNNQETDNGSPLSKEPAGSTNDGESPISQGETQSNGAPHMYSTFKGTGALFAGGAVVADYDIASIRRVSHPEFIRLVFDFSRAGLPGEAPPVYTVTLEENPYRLVYKLEGVVAASALQKKEQVLALSKYFKDITFKKDTNSSSSEVVLYLNGPAVFQVFEIGDPARLVVVMKPEGAGAQPL